MTASYLFKLEDMAPLLHGLWGHIETWTWRTGRVHAHRCLNCKHPVICTCARQSRNDLAACPWCTWPWALVWTRRAYGRSNFKLKKRQTARRSKQPVA